MSIAKIQTGDQVKIISGNYKGLFGQVLKVVKKTFKNGAIKVRATVSSVPKIAKYRKSNSFQGQNVHGQKLEKDRTIDISNLSLVTQDQKVSKSKIQTDDNGKKYRVLKKTNEKVVANKIEKIKKIVEESDLKNNN